MFYRLGAPPWCSAFSAIVYEERAKGGVMSCMQSHNHSSMKQRNGTILFTWNVSLALKDPLMRLQTFERTLSHVFAQDHVYSTFAATSLFKGPNQSLILDCGIGHLCSHNTVSHAFSSHRSLGIKFLPPDQIYKSSKSIYRSPHDPASHSSTSNCRSSPKWQSRRCLRRHDLRQVALARSNAHHPDRPPHQFLASVASQSRIDKADWLRWCIGSRVITYTLSALWIFAQACQVAMEREDVRHYVVRVVWAAFGVVGREDGAGGACYVLGVWFKQRRENTVSKQKGKSEVRVI